MERRLVLWDRYAFPAATLKLGTFSLWPLILLVLSGCGSSGLTYAPIGGPPSCGSTFIINGTFNFGFQCWAQVIVASDQSGQFPRFDINTIANCVPQSQLGNAWAAIEVPAGADGYIAQAFIFHSAPTTLSFRTWGTQDPVTVTVGIVFPAGISTGSETVLDRFVPPLEQSGSTTCTGLGPVTKTYSFSGFSPGNLVELRLHATSFGIAGANANFDDVTSSP